MISLNNSNLTLFFLKTFCYIFFSFHFSDMDALLNQLGLDDSGAPAAATTTSPMPTTTPTNDGGEANVDEVDVDNLMAQLGIEAAPTAVTATSAATTPAGTDGAKPGRRELPPGACTGPADLRQRRAKAAGPAGKKTTKKTKQNKSNKNYYYYFPVWMDVFFF